MKEGTKHPDVESFLILYQQLRDWTHEEPSQVLQIAQKDETFKCLCSKLFWSAIGLELAEESSRRRFAENVGSDFIAAWRDYEKRYVTVLGSVAFLDFKFDGEGEPYKGSEAEIRYQIAADRAKSDAGGVASAINLAELEIANGDYDNDDFIREVEDGIAAWKRLARIGVDLEGMFRRRSLVPFILIPVHVTHNRDNSEQVSLRNLLQQAHEAFVFGTPFAALALMRAILERVLRECYRQNGQYLKRMIDGVKLPSGIEKVRLYRLNSLAKKVLHVPEKASPKNDKVSYLSNDEIHVPDNLEPEIINHLFLLRDLIEAAP